MITWQAYYTDGVTLAQSAGATYRDIDRSRLLAFDLLDNGRLLVRVDLRRDSVADSGLGPKRLIWRKRTIAGTDGNQTAVHLAGWQRNVNGRNVQAICYVFEDGVMVLGGQFGGGDFMDPVVPFPWEDDLTG